MKRNHSELILRNLATSIQNSMLMQTHKYPKEQLAVVRVRSSSQLPMPQSHNSCTLTQQQKDNRIFIIEKQITYLQKGMQQSKATIRSYTQELDQYQCISKKMQSLEKQISNENQEIQRVRNQIFMIVADFQANKFNQEERIVQKQFYQTFIQNYCAQYPTESQFVLQIFQLEDINVRISKDVQQLQSKIRQKKEDIQTWKKDKDFDLNECRLKNDLKTARMHLYSYQDQCDTFCQEHGFRKIRQLLCLFFKNYSKRNGISSSEAQNGLDIFVCRHGLSEEFSEFIRERLVYSKPKSKAIDQYLEQIFKMELIFKNNSSQKNRRLHSLQMQEIKELQEEKAKKLNEKSKNQGEIQNIVKKIDDLFGHQSVAVIEYLRQKANKYDIKEIKQTLKQKKKDQDQRISEVRNAKKRIQEIQQSLQRHNGGQNQESKRTIQQLTQQMMAHEHTVQKMRQKQSKLNKQKHKLELFINSAISKWRQRDQNKIKLKELYKELSHTKKYEKHSKGKRQPVKSVQNVRKSTEFPLAQSRQSRQSKNNSVNLLSQSKSILSLNNPYQQIMKRQTAAYQPIISDCQLILSKKLNSRQPKELTLNMNTHFKALQSQDLKQSVIQKSNSRSNMKKTSLSIKNKQNELRQKRSKYQSQSQTQTKYSLSTKPSGIGKQKVGGSCSQRGSLSQMILSKFNR